MISTKGSDSMILANRTSVYTIFSNYDLIFSAGFRIYIFDNLGHMQF